MSDAVLVADPEHSSLEDRFYLLGLSARLRVLVVVHYYRVDDEIVRLISARKATSSERAQYDARWKRSLDFSKGQRNPYASKLKRPVTIRLDEFTVDYFKAMAEDTEIPYQTLINLYLRECAGTGRRLAMPWRNAKRGAS